MNNITREGIAAELSGIEYPVRINQALSDALNAAGLVVVFGASDDLMEFRGAIYDELCVYDGGTAYVDRQGLLPERENIDDDSDLQAYFTRKPKAAPIEALWCKEDGYSWTYDTTIPHATFEVVEDGYPYCRGIVFSLTDVPEVTP